MKLAFLASNAPAAQVARSALLRIHRDHAIEDADAIVALGGDGFMLDALSTAARLRKPVYGMNRGTVGFLMNDFSEDRLEDRIEAASEQVIHPLHARITTRDGDVRELHAINEISVLRQGAQATDLSLHINGEERLVSLAADGVLLATPAGSTAYNHSAFGPILPIGANVLALTPIAAFRPRRWRGAVLSDTAHVEIVNRHPAKRPVMVNADSASVEHVLHVEISLDRTVHHRLLFDPGHGLEERILREQFL